MSRRDRKMGSPRDDLDTYDEYDGTPYLTALSNFCLVVGVFVGAYAVIFLIGYLHRGVRAYWPLILIIVVDIAVNTALRLLRYRRRRALGLVDRSLDQRSRGRR